MGRNPDSFYTRFLTTDLEDGFDPVLGHWPPLGSEKEHILAWEMGLRAVESDVFP
jgi:hypothetical protein